MPDTEVTSSRPDSNCNCRFVYCILDNACLNRNTGTILCLNCYHDLSEPTRNDFEHVLGHHLNIGSIVPLAKCRVCGQNVSQPFPVRHCLACLNHFISLTNQLTREGRSVVNLPDPTSVLLGGGPGIRTLVITSLLNQPSD